LVAHCKRSFSESSPIIYPSLCSVYQGAPEPGGRLYEVRAVRRPARSAATLHTSEPEKTWVTEQRHSVWSLRQARPRGYRSVTASRCHATCLRPTYDIHQYCNRLYLPTGQPIPSDGRRTLGLQESVYAWLQNSPSGVDIATPTLQRDAPLHASFENIPDRRQ